MKQANYQPEDDENPEGTGEYHDEDEEREFLTVDDATFALLVTKQSIVPRYDQMTEEERKLREQKCYCCGGDGHTRRQCPLDKALNAIGLGFRSKPRAPLAAKGPLVNKGRVWNRAPTNQGKPQATSTPPPTTTTPTTPTPAPQNNAWAPNDPFNAAPLITLDQ
jgi:hypothetical protein